MKKKDLKQENGIIFSIRKKNSEADDKNFYISCTTNLQKSVAEIARSVSNGCSPLYRYIKENGGLTNFDFQIEKEFHDISFRKLELLKYDMINELQPALNTVKRKPDVLNYCWYLYERANPSDSLDHFRRVMKLNQK